MQSAMTAGEDRPWIAGLMFRDGFALAAVQHDARRHDLRSAGISIFGLECPDERERVVVEKQRGAKPLVQTIVGARAARAELNACEKCARGSLRLPERAGAEEAWGLGVVASLGRLRLRKVMRVHVTE